MTQKILALPGNDVFAARLAEQLDAEQLAAEFRSFPDGESYVRIDGDWQGAEVLLVATLDRPDSKFLPMALAAQTLRVHGAARVTLVAPYLGYMRQDKAFHPGEAISAPIFARLVSSVVDELVTVDPHLHRIDALGEVYSIPSINVHAAPALAAWIAERVADPLLVGPDVESKQWVSAVARESGAPYVALEKVRRGDRDVEVSVPHLKDYAGRTPVIVDDIVSTARTMIETVRHLRALGAPAPVCVGVHAIFAGDAYAELQKAGASTIATTNTIPHPSNDIDVAPLIAAALS